MFSNSKHNTVCWLICFINFVRNLRVLQEFQFPVLTSSCNNLIRCSSCAGGTCILSWWIINNSTQHLKPFFGWVFNFLPSLKWYPYGKTGSCWICCLDINISLCLQIHNVNLFWIALYCCSCMQPPQAKLRRGMHVQSSTAMLISIPRCELPLLPSKPKKSRNTKLHLSLCTRVLNFTFILIFFWQSAERPLALVDNTA